jgi:phosphatidylglycerol lysyltransferase
MTDTVTSTDYHFDGDGLSTGVHVWRPKASRPDSDPQYDTLLDATDQARHDTPPLDIAQVSSRQTPAAPSGVRQVSDRWRRVEHQAFTHGKVYDSYFATEAGWKRFWSPDRSGLVSYRRLGKYVKVIGGLLASEEDKPQLLREFITFAQSHRLIVTFFNVTAEDAPIFREHGFQVTKWGEEPFVDLQECTWSGKQYEWVRRQTNYCRRQGITVVEHCRDQMDEAEWNLLIQNLQDISDAQLATKSHAGAIRLLEGQLAANSWGRRRLFVAYSGGFPQRIEGFLVALPTQEGRQWAFEMYRHRSDAVRGVVPHLFHVAMMRMQTEGIEAVSLCLAPGLGCEEPLTGDSAMTRRALVFGMKYLNFLFDFAGIYHFKSRFRPHYESRYICALPGTTLGSALALFRISGMMEFDRKRVGANLKQKLFKRRQRTQLASRERSLEVDRKSVEKREPLRPALAPDLELTTKSGISR